MPITNITNENVWTPVKIEMEFTTRDEFGVFLSIMGNPFAIADTIHGNHRLGHMTRKEIENIIDRMPGGVFDQLVNLWK